MASHLLNIKLLCGLGGGVCADVRFDTDFAVSRRVFAPDDRCRCSLEFIKVYKGFIVGCTCT